MICMILIDGALYSGSGSIVRQALAFSALTGQSVHLVNARAKREKSGLRRQHVRVIEAMCELVYGKVRGVWEGSQEITFHPGNLLGNHEGPSHYCWDMESAGSTTMVALAVLPVLAFRPSPTTVEFCGGVFQDFAPSLFHLQHVLLPLVHRMGLDAHIRMNRPGYVPSGKGSLSLTVHPLKQGLQGIILEKAGPIEQIWGIALASHLEEKQVSQRMAESARKQFAQAGYMADISVLTDTFAQQPGAALAIFADCAGSVRLGADGAGALGRRSEDIGRSIAKQLLADVHAGATLDRFAADQIIPFAALAKGNSRFLIPCVTDHVQTSAWLVQVFLGAETKLDDHGLRIAGIGRSIGQDCWENRSRMRGEM
jgi:RNA 3'-terminal phosphate cyclase (ATP)